MGGPDLTALQNLRLGLLRQAAAGSCPREFHGAEARQQARQKCWGPLFMRQVSRSTAALPAKRLDQTGNFFEAPRREQAAAAMAAPDPNQVVRRL